MQLICSHCGFKYTKGPQPLCPRCGYRELPTDQRPMPEDWDSSYEWPFEGEDPTKRDPAYETPALEPESVDPDDTPVLGTPVLFDLTEPERTRIEIDYARKLQTIHEDYLAHRLAAQLEYERRIKELEDRSVGTDDNHG